MKRGQVSVEFLIIAAFAFVLIIPVLLLFLSEANNLNQDITSAQANKLAEELVDAVNNVYYLGEPTKKTLRIYVPENVQEVVFVGNRISILMNTSISSYVINKFTAGNVTGSLNTNAGLHNIEVLADSGIVRVEG